MRTITLAVCLLFSLGSQASTIKLNYSLFFGYMKTMYKLDYEYVTTAFYLQDRETKQHCNIKNVQILVDNQLEPILFEAQGRLLPFYSDQHRKDGGMLVVDIDDNKAVSSCDLQVIVMAKQKQLQYLNRDKLVIVSEQLEGVLRKNAGMIGKYFLPEYAGVRIQLADSVQPQQMAQLAELASKQENGTLFVSQQQFSVIDKINDLRLPILRITPWMRNSL